MMLSIADIAKEELAAFEGVVFVAASDTEARQPDGSKAEEAVESAAD